MKGEDMSMAYDDAQLTQISARLDEGKLSDEDVAVLRELIDFSKKRSTAEEVGGRPVIAHLPFGMDVIR
jgi:hypothetical protein